MANALRSMAPPPMPRPPAAVSQQPAPPQQQMPAPTHQQVVAALRHFAIIRDQLESALRDPDLGKVTLKPKLIDGVVGLVADRIMSPGAAVKELSTFPDRLFDQRGWLLDHLNQAMAARDAVLDAHRTTNLPMSEPPPTPSADSHLQDIAALHGHFGGGNG